MDIQGTEASAAQSDPTGPDSPPSAHKDRYTGLCIFGVMEILAGAMVTMGLVASLLIMTFRNVPTPPEGKAFTVLLVDFCLSVATLAIALIVLGIGTMRARRWAWALNPILSWFAVLMWAETRTREGCFHQVHYTAWPIERMAPVSRVTGGTMSNRLRSDFLKLAALSMLALTVGAVGCGGESGGSGTDASGDATSCTTVVSGTTPEGSFVPTGSMTVARFNQTATLLSNGKVLMAGGSDGSNVLASAELYDPETGMFASTGSMTAARARHVATSLSNGEVLITGGNDGSRMLTSAELYDPGAGTFTATGDMTLARIAHTTTLLLNGMALVVGGEDGSAVLALASAELYDPGSGKFTSTGSLARARAFHTATPLNDGKVLVTGGADTNWNNLTSAELYDPAAMAFVPTTAMGNARAFHAATLIQSGAVLITGGATAELYDPVAGTFTSAGFMIDPVLEHSATLLSDGRVLIASGNVLAGSCGLVGPAELYDPRAGTFTSAGNMTVVGAAPNATLLPNGKVLIAGGAVPTPGDPSAQSSAFASAELFQE